MKVSPEDIRDFLQVVEETRLIGGRQKDMVEAISSLDSVGGSEEYWIEVAIELALSRDYWRTKARRANRR